MRNKFIGIAISVCVLSLFTGCGFIPELPELTQNQEALITEYAAGLLLKYDKAYDNGLLSEEELAVAEKKEIERLEKAEKQKKLAEEYRAKSEKAKKEEESKKDNKKDKKENESKAVVEAGPTIIGNDAVGDFIGVSNTAISYTGFETTNSFLGDGSAFAVDAANGNKFVVAKFKVNNLADGENEINLFDKNISYKLYCSNGKSYQSSSTWLLNDLSTYKNALKGKAGEDVILLFEIPDGVDEAGASIEISNGSDVASIGL